VAKTPTSQWSRRTVFPFGGHIDRQPFAGKPRLKLPQFIERQIVEPRVTSRLTDCGARPKARSTTSEAAWMRHDHGTERPSIALTSTPIAFADRPHELDRVARIGERLFRPASNLISNWDILWVGTRNRKW
jgi:hypothetical protein